MQKVFHLFLEVRKVFEFFDKIQNPSGNFYLCTTFLLFFLRCVQKIIMENIYHFDDGNQQRVQGQSKKRTRLQDKLSCILEELRIYLEPAILTICTVPYNMMADQIARKMIERVRNINEIIKQIQQRSVLPLRMLDVARMMEDSLPEDASSDGIHFDRPRGTEWLNVVFQRHIKFL